MVGWLFCLAKLLRNERVDKMQDMLVGSRSIIGRNVTLSFS